MVQRGPRVMRVLAALAAPAIMVTAVTIGACGGGGSPTAPPSATPTPVASASATPAPVQGACERIGIGPGNGQSCPVQGPSFTAQIEAAMDQLIAQQPQIFNLGETNGPGSYRIVSPGQYYVGLIERLDRMGLCADFDGEELQVKGDNSFNDQYDVQSASNFMLRGPSTYKSTCIPASFPKSLGNPPSTAGCSLPGSREKACGRENPQLLGAVEAGIDKVMRDHPEYFDFGNTQPGTGFVRIVNGDAYFRDLTAAINGQGLCAFYDGEEMAVKRENRFSEQYDLFGGEGYARRGEGSYQVTCYPAAF
jgi:hypothetical protein